MPSQEERMGFTLRGTPEDCEGYTNEPSPLYSLDERVEINGGTRYVTGYVRGTKWIYHDRPNRYTWGYRIEYEGETAGLGFEFVPEGYLRKIDSINKVH